MGVEKIKRPVLQGDAREDGQRVLNTVVATYDFDVDGGTIGDYNLGVTIPAGSLVTRVAYDVETTFTTAAADAGTIGLEAGTVDLITAIAVSDASDPWDQGGHLAATDAAVRVAAAGELIMDIAVQAVTAGKVHFVVTYAVVE